MNNKHFSIRYLILFCTFLIGCSHGKSLEEYARVQLQESIEPFLETSFPGKKAWSIEDLKTVYTNDSICLLQCTARIRDSINRKVVRDYRYMYKIEMDFSRAAGRPVFFEDFENTLCLTDEQIRFARKRIKKNAENVYQLYSLVGTPVNTTRADCPF